MRTLPEPAAPRRQAENRSIQGVDRGHERGREIGTRVSLGPSQGG
jgi:hypothetical protein